MIESGIRGLDLSLDGEQPKRQPVDRWTMVRLGSYLEALLPPGPGRDAVAGVLADATPLFMAELKRVVVYDPLRLIPHDAAITATAHDSSPSAPEEVVLPATRQSVLEYLAEEISRTPNVWAVRRAFLGTIAADAFGRLQTHGAIAPDDLVRDVLTLLTGLSDEDAFYSRVFDLAPWLRRILNQSAEKERGDGWDQALLSLATILDGGAQTLTPAKKARFVRRAVAYLHELLRRAHSLPLDPALVSSAAGLLARSLEDAVPEAKDNDLLRFARRQLAGISARSVAAPFNGDVPVEALHALGLERTAQAGAVACGTMIAISSMEATFDLSPVEKAVLAASWGAVWLTFPRENAVAAFIRLASRFPQDGEPAVIAKALVLASALHRALPVSGALEEQLLQPDIGLALEILFATLAECPKEWLATTKQDVLPPLVVSLIGAIDRSGRAGAFSTLRRTLRALVSPRNFPALNPDWSFRAGLSMLIWRLYSGLDLPLVDMSDLAKGGLAVRFSLDAAFGAEQVAAAAMAMDNLIVDTAELPDDLNALVHRLYKDYFANGPLVACGVVSLSGWRRLASEAKGLTRSPDIRIALREIFTDHAGKAERVRRSPSA